MLIVLRERKKKNQMILVLVCQIALFQKRELRLDRIRDQDLNPDPDQSTNRDQGLDLNQNKDHGLGLDQDRGKDQGILEATDPEQDLEVDPGLGIEGGEEGVDHQIGRDQKNRNGLLLLLKLIKS